MLLSSRLKLGSMLFSAFWALVMFWWSGEYSIANGVILAVFGALAAYVWYRLMRRKVLRARLPKQQ